MVAKELPEELFFLCLAEQGVIDLRAFFEYMKKDRMKGAEQDASLSLFVSFDKAVFHFCRGCAAEGQYKNAGRIDLLMIDQIMDALGKNQCFAAARPRDDFAGPEAAAYCLPLGGVKICVHIVRWM